MTAQVTGGSLQRADWHEHQLPKDQPFHIVLLSMIKFPPALFPPSTTEESGLSSFAQTRLFT